MIEATPLLTEERFRPFSHGLPILPSRIPRRSKCRLAAQRRIDLVNKFQIERSGKFRPEGEDERLECLRWLVFDNHKVNGFLGPYRFLKNFAPAPNPGGEAFLLGRIGGNLAIVNQRLEKAPYLLGEKPTIADISLAGYFFYPPDEFGFDIAKDHPAIGAWTERIKALPGWKHPYELMPGYPLKRG